MTPRKKSLTPHASISPALVGAMERTALRHEARALLESLMCEKSASELQKLVAELELSAASGARQSPQPTATRSRTDE